MALFAFASFKMAKNIVLRKDRNILDLPPLFIFSLTNFLHAWNGLAVETQTHEER